MSRVPLKPRTERYLAGFFAAAVTASLSAACLAEAGSDWCVFMPIQVWNEYDVGLVASMAPKTPADNDRVSCPYILRESSYDLSPVDVPGRRYWFSFMGDKVTPLPCPAAALIAVQCDSSWSETDVDVVHLFRVPRVEVVDTSGVSRARFVNAYGPSWSPDGTLLAMSIIRAPVVGSPGHQVAYPWSPDSVLVWEVESGARWSFPIAAREVGWWGSTLMVDNGDTTFYLSPRGPDIHPAWQRGVHVTPDGRFAYSFHGPLGLRVWASHPKSELTGAIRKRLGGISIQGDPPPFWLSKGRDHVLCVGVLDGQHNANFLPSNKPIWRTVFVDVGRMKVLRSLQARLVAPVADYSRVVVRKGDRFEFVGLGDPK